MTPGSSWSPRSAWTRPGRSIRRSSSRRSRSWSRRCPAGIAWPSAFPASSAARIDALGAPVRVANDAEVQGLAAVQGTGVELVVTLGTGFGSALFADGRPCAHLELGHHQFRSGRTYEEALGDEALNDVGKRKWRRRVGQAIDQLRVLTDFDHLYIGGGNARHLEADSLPPDVTTVDNKDGILGGMRLWQTDSH